MSLFDQPLGSKTKRGLSSPAQTPLVIRQAKPTDVSSLAKLEKMCYQQLQKGEDGKFLQPIKCGPVIDQDFDVELYPKFLLGEDGFKKLLELVNRSTRVQVVTQSEHIIACMVTEVDNTTKLIDIHTLLLHPTTPITTSIKAMNKFIDWVEAIGEHSLRELTVTYDLPDALDTPMQRVFLFFKELGWEYKRKSNTYCKNVDSWQFKRTMGGDKRRKKDLEAA